MLKSVGSLAVLLSAIAILPEHGAARSSHAETTTGNPAAQAAAADAKSDRRHMVGRFKPVTNADLITPPDADWLMWRRTYNGWGHSPLTQIGRNNVSDLTIAWKQPMEAGGQEAMPLVRNGIMYLPQPGGEVVRAVNAATGELLWEHKRPLPSKTFGLAGRNRNLAIYGDLVYHATSDAHVVALDAKTGAVRWDVQIRDWREGVQHTSGPLVVKGMLILPQSCMPFLPDNGKPGPDCAITALDAKSGKLLWKRSTITLPDDPNDKSWGGVPYGERWPVSAWMPGSYDPKLNLIYWGTGSGRPYPSSLKGTGEADLLYTNSTLALRPADGSIAWYFQHHRKDEFDNDHVFERLLVDTMVAPDPSSVRWINPKVKAGEKRQVVTGIPGKDGLVWTLDRKTGAFLWARETTEQNMTVGLDLDTGRRIENSAIRNVKLGVPSRVCPFPAGGGKNWNAGAYSPALQVMFMPLGNACSDAAMTAERTQRPFGPGVGGGQSHAPKPTSDSNPNIGRIEAISVTTGKTLWKYEQRAPVMSLLSTGGLVFFGDVNKRFAALDERTGEIVWTTVLDSPVSGFPITYEVDGRQYIAVATGGGTSLEWLAPALVPELDVSPRGNTLYVFALPQR